MQIRFGYDIAFRAAQATPILLTLHAHETRSGDLLQRDDMRTEPYVPLALYRDGFGNRITRLVAPAGVIRITTDALIQDSGEQDNVNPFAQQLPVESLPDETLVYLLGSRYCDTDNLSAAAWRLFGNTPLGWARVQAVCDYVHGQLTFGYEYARSTKTATEALNEGAGVCRDYAHLAIAFCRCLNIPARYCTGYLGDIGVPPVDLPMDFSGWFEAYLDGCWYTFDPRHNTPRIGRILIARGRDAADVAISTTFGPSTLEHFRVWTDEVAA